MTNSIKLIVEGQARVSEMAKNIEHIKQEQEEIKINVDVLMKVVPEHSTKIEELKKRA